MGRRLTRRRVLELAAAAGASAAFPGFDAWGRPKSRKIERDEAQLFVDDELIAHARELRRTLHQPRKDGGGRAPLIQLDEEFDGVPATQEANGTIVWDPHERRWVMIARAASARGISGPEGVRLYRFTSRDGMRWQKGDDGRPQRIEIDMSHPSGTSASNTHHWCFHLDRSDPQWPYKGWIYYNNWGHELEGVYLMRSADGRAWERGPQMFNCWSGQGDPSHVRFRDGDRELVGPGDVNGFSYDAKRDRFLAQFKFLAEDPNGPPGGPPAPGNRLRSRGYAWVDRIDEPIDTARLLRKVELVPPAARRGGDRPYDEYYASSAWRYESMWLGGLKVWHGAGDYPWSAAGCAFLKLVSSRDGLNWGKVRFRNDSGVREVWIPNGPEGGVSGRNDGGYMTDFSQGPLRIGNELIYYYGSSSYGKNQPGAIGVSGGGIFRSRLRVDGFVSVDRGTLTTPPLGIRGRELLLNAKGPVRVEVRSVGGDALGSTVARGDALGHRLRFGRGRTFRDVSGGRPVRLGFTAGPGARLYSFRAA